MRVHSTKYTHQCTMCIITHTCITQQKHINIAEENTSDQYDLDKKGNTEANRTVRRTEHVNFIKTVIIIAEENISDQYLGKQKGQHRKTEN